MYCRLFCRCLFVAFLLDWDPSKTVSELCIGISDLIRLHTVDPFSVLHSAYPSCLMQTHDPTVSLLCKMLNYTWTDTNQMLYAVLLWYPRIWTEKTTFPLFYRLEDQTKKLHKDMKKSTEADIGVLLTQCSYLISLWKKHSHWSCFLSCTNLL